MAVGMKFFSGRRMRAHVDMKAPKRNKKGDRQVVILFRITLNGDTVRSAPDVVKWAYEGVKTKSEDHIGIKKEIEGVNVEFFQLEESKRSNLRLKALYLAKLVVKEISSGKGDLSIVLTFQAEYEWDEVIWRWLGDNYKTDVFLEFDAAQATLLDLEEAETKGEDVDAGQLEMGQAGEAAPEDGKSDANGKGRKGKSFNIEDFPDRTEKAATGSE